MTAQKGPGLEMVDSLWPPAIKGRGQQQSQRPGASPTGLCQLRAALAELGGLRRLQQGCLAPDTENHYPDPACEAPFGPVHAHPVQRARTARSVQSLGCVSVGDEEKPLQSPQGA